MPRSRAIAVPQCTVCGHKKRRQIEAALAAGTSLRAICRANGGLSPQSLMRHRDRHVPPVVHRSTAIALYERGNGALPPPGQSGPALVEPAPTVGPRLHPVRWWAPSPDPQMGDRCMGCLKNHWWVTANGVVGGCSSCWTPGLEHRKIGFKT
jgi:hypothetical protein